MFDFQVTTPILNSPYEEPNRHWKIHEDQPAELVEARRKPVYFYRFPGKETANAEREDRGIQIELLLVSIIRRQIQAWRDAGYPGASATTLDLLRHWSRDGRFTPLFYAQREAAEAIIFLTEARADFLQGIDVPLDEPSDTAKAEGVRAFKRLACKMATGTGKTTVMGMLAAWSILNKVANTGDRRFSDAVLIVCPNVTIRTRLAELDPMAGEASLYRTRDLIPARLMPELKLGRVMVTNWHVFEKQSPNPGYGSSRVVKTGVAQTRQETIRIAEKSTTARGSRYLSLADYERQRMLGLIETIKEHRDSDGHLEKVDVRATRYVESDTRWLKRVLGSAFGGKQNVLVLNDEAHHAYRIRSEVPDEAELDVFGEDEEAEAYFKEATVWVDGLDRVHKHRGINVCLDFSATPYFLGRVSNLANRPFPWVVSDFSLTEAIESGLTKIPQLAVRDSSGASIPGYFNIWRWILPQLNTSERGGKKAAPKPEAILRYAHTPIAMLGGLWRDTFARWQADGEDRPPVFIIVCKNTKIAKVVYEWIADNKPPYGIPTAGLPELVNREGEINTIRVDSKVVEDTDSGSAKGDEDRWMRVTLDTVGKRDWPRDTQGMPIHPEGFAEVAEKLKRSTLEPPGKRIRCIVSVGMLTEGWDCNTVTHIVGLRPFMSQLLCEQVVGRALRRASYAVEENGLLSEEIAQVFGVPFEVVPFKDNPQRERPVPAKTWRIRALPERAHLEIKFPRVEGFVQQAVERLSFAVDTCPELTIDPTQIPQEVQLKAGLASNTGRPSLFGPGKLQDVNLKTYRAGRRLQELEFDLARELARTVLEQAAGQLAPSEVFGPCLIAVKQFIATRVTTLGAADKKDAFLSPYYGIMLERLVTAMSVADQGGAELPKLETNRPPGTTADVDFVSRREPVPVMKSHVNAVVADTAKWEQQAAYFIDTHPRVVAFVKNAGLGLGVPYTHDGQRHDYVPDFVIRRDDGLNIVLETKGFDRLAETKLQAARRWVAAVNAHGGYGRWAYRMVREPNAVSTAISMANE